MREKKSRGLNKKRFKKLRSDYRKTCKHWMYIWKTGDWRFLMNEEQEQAYEYFIQNITVFAQKFNITNIMAADILGLRLD